MTWAGHTTTARPGIRRSKEGLSKKEIIRAI
jgi:hypothetical protein